MKVLAWNIDSSGIENTNTIMYISTLLISKNVKPTLLILPRYEKKRQLPDQHWFQHTHIAFTFDSLETAKELGFVQLCKLESKRSRTFGLRVTWPPKACAMAWWPKLMPTVFTFFLSNSLISCILAPQSYGPTTCAQSSSTRFHQSDHHVMNLLLILNVYKLPITVPMSKLLSDWRF